MIQNKGQQWPVKKSGVFEPVIFDRLFWISFWTVYLEPVIFDCLCLNGWSEKWQSEAVQNSTWSKMIRLDQILWSEGPNLDRKVIL